MIGSVRKTQCRVRPLQAGLFRKKEPGLNFQKYNIATGRYDLCRGYKKQIAALLIP